MLIVLNPEMINLALFVDAIGLEMFLLLFEIQAVAILGALLNHKIKPAITYMKHLARWGSGCTPDAGSCRRNEPVGDGISAANIGYRVGTMRGSRRR